MSAVTRPLGPLPSRVYWTRRLILLVVVLALVFGLARLFGGGSGGNGPSAQPVGAQASSTPSSPSTTAASSPAAIATAATVTSDPTASTSASPSAGKSAAKSAGKSPGSTALPEPSGPCSVNDIVVTPTIKDQAHAGKAVTFAMQLTTKSTLACTFDVAPDSLVVKVTSGSDRVWSTQDCPNAVPTKSVVVRKDTPTSVDVKWSAMRSDSACSKTTQWAQPGYYHALAAAFGAEPVDAQFELMKPVRPTVTAKPSPGTKSQAKSGSKKPASKPTTKPSSKPNSKPSSKP